MKIKISVPEVVELMKELQSNPTRIFEMIGMNVQKDVGDLSDKPDESRVDAFFRSA